MFDTHQCGSAPLAAECEALYHAAGNEQNDSPGADLVLGRQYTDQSGENAHAEKCDHQHLLAAQFVTEVTEHRPADRAQEECDRERRQRHQ